MPFFVKKISSEHLYLAPLWGKCIGNNFVKRMEEVALNEAFD
jgi:hypothetical protein